jgi:ATP synthase protein I
MTEPERPDPLAALGERLERARRAQEGRRGGQGGAGSSSGASIGIGFRIGLELVVAVFVGFAIGWAIDRWFGTRPWGELVFLFLGIGAGMMNVFRVVKGMGMAVGYKNDGGSGTKPDAAKRNAIVNAEWDEDED